jgi:SAM-dependent methyltransferase
LLSTPIAHKAMGVILLNLDNRIIMDWKHGYFAESGYTYDFYSGTTPSRLSWVAAIKGLITKTNNFRYLDLGCGQGVSLIHMAALHPDSEFVGVDFMPEHIAHANNLASKAGLDNIIFIEGDFTDLAGKCQQLGKFDFIVAHGITTWVSENIRESLFKIASLTLHPGGLMYNGYNTYPGWLEMAPFQHLVSQFTNKYNGIKSIDNAKKIFLEMHNSRSPTYDHFPKLFDRLNQISKYKESYLMQEYNNQYWAPVFSSQMLKLANDYKLTYVASSSPAEIFDIFIPPNLADLFIHEKDANLRETIRDIVLATGFRRDIYVKGGLSSWPFENKKFILNQRYIVTGLNSIPDDNGSFEVKAGSLDIKGDSRVYKPILNSFGENGNSFGDVLKEHPELSIETLSQIISILIHGGWLAIESKVDYSTAKRLNISIANACLEGAPYTYLCMPRLGTSAKISSLDVLMIGLINSGIKPSNLKNKLIETINSLNLKIKINEIHLKSNIEYDALISSEIDTFINIKFKNYQRIGAL